MRCLRCLQLTLCSVFIAFSASGQNSLAPAAARVLRANLQLSSLLAGRLELRGHGENLVSDADSQMSGRPVELYRRVEGAIENHWNVHASFVDLEETMRDLYYVLTNEDETPEVSSWTHPALAPKAHETVYWINKSGKVAASGSPMKRDGQGVDPAIADDKYSAAEQKVLEGVREQSALLRKLGAEFRSLQGENSSLATALVDLRRYTRLKSERVLDFNRMSSVSVRACLQQGDPAIFEESYRGKKAEKHKGIEVAERRIAATLGRLRVLLDGGVDPGGLSDSKGRSSSRHHLKEITRDVERGERECSRVPEDAPTAGTATCQVQEGPMRASHEDAGAEEIAQAERSDGGGDERTDFSGEGFETAQRQIARELGSSLGVADFARIGAELTDKYRQFDEDDQSNGEGQPIADKHDAGQNLEEMSTDLTALLAALKGQARHLRKTGASAASLCEGIDKRIEEVDSILVLNQNQNPNPNPYAPERLSLFELSGGAPRSGALRLLSPAMRFDWDFEISRGNFKIQKR